MYYQPAPLPTLPEIESAITSQDPNGEPLKITVLRNITVEGIEPYLRYLAADLGFSGEIVFGGYDQILQDALSLSGDLLSEGTGAVFVLSPLPNLSPVLDSGFNGCARGDVTAELDRLEAFFKSVIHAVRAHTDSPILWYGIESPPYAALGIADDQQMGQSAAIQSLNDRLKRVLAEVSGAYFVNTDRCLARLGLNQYYDLRHWYMARAPYTRLALAELALEGFKFIRAIRGFSKKCLVLDCDNTLWGGIVGEDGIGDIEIGNDNYPGVAYLEFQKEIISLYQRGVILALCSKNNEQDVINTLTHNRDMLLKPEHFTAWRINWNNKAANIQEIASELNVGLDSLLFVDDSEFEIDLVRNLLPEIQTLHLPPGRPIEYRWMLAASGAFDTPALTQEDRQRSNLYRAERQRRETLESTNDLESYYQILSIELHIALADSSVAARIAQQTQKTNQFNLTTQRYSEADVHRMISAADFDVFYLRANDKFGDMGIVGTCICQYLGEKAVIDTLLLSCRALGRGIENRFLEEILHLLHSNGVEFVSAQYIRTEKNSQAAEFYLANSFSPSSGKAGAGSWFTRDLAKISARGLAHFSVVESPLGRIVRYPNSTDV
jgi:FkbH-like protein